MRGLPQHPCGAGARRTFVTRCVTAWCPCSASGRQRRQESVAETYPRCGGDGPALGRRLGDRWRWDHERDRGSARGDRRDLADRAGDPGLPRGVVFSTVLGVVAGHRRFEELSAFQFSGWEVVAGLLLGAFAAAMGVGAPFIAVTALACAVSAAGSLAARWSRRCSRPPQRALPRLHGPPALTHMGRSGAARAVCVARATCRFPGPVEETAQTLAAEPADAALSARRTSAAARAGRTRTPARVRLPPE